MGKLKKIMKYILKNKEIELSEEEIQEIIKQNNTIVKEAKENAFE